MATSLQKKAIAISSNADGTNKETKIHCKKKSLGLFQASLPLPNPLAHVFYTAHQCTSAIAKAEYIADAGCAGFPPAATSALTADNCPCQHAVINGVTPSCILREREREKGDSCFIQRNQERTRASRVSQDVDGHDTCGKRPESTRF